MYMKWAVKELQVSALIETLIMRKLWHIWTRSIAVMLYYSLTEYKYFL